MSDPVRIERLEGGAVAKVILDAGKGNVLSRKVIEALGQAFAELGGEGAVRSVVLTHEGPHFSFGASVPEHAPGEVERMLPEFSALFRTVARSAVPVVAAVRGACLGGGFEVALAAQHIVAADDAKLGCPEVTLGVFPPVAAAVLPLRVAQPIADRVVVLGETFSGKDACAVGLVDEAVAAEQVEQAALDWARRYVELSGAAVRFATRASRSWWDEALRERLTALEELYLKELMETADAREGIAAFLEKRRPAWVHA